MFANCFSKIRTDAKLSAIDVGCKTSRCNSIHPVALHDASGSDTTSPVLVSESPFNHRIVPAVSPTAHAAYETVGFEQLPEQLAGIL